MHSSVQVRMSLSLHLSALARQRETEFILHLHRILWPSICPRCAVKGHTLECLSSLAKCPRHLNSLAETVWLLSLQQVAVIFVVCPSLVVLPQFMLPYCLLYWSVSVGAIKCQHTHGHNEALITVGPFDGQGQEPMAS